MARLEPTPGGVAAEYGDVFPASAQLDEVLFGEQLDCIAAAAIAAEVFMEQYEGFDIPP